MFTAVTVLTLGLGAGVVTGLFAVVDAVLLHPVAEEQDRVVRVWMHDVQRGLDRHPIAYPEFLDLQRETRVFERLAAINYANAMSAAVIIGEQPVRVALTPVSSTYFSAMNGGQPMLGRWLQAADEHEGAEIAAVVSEPFWRRHAAANPGLVGQRLRWSGSDRTLIVVGIAPGSLDYPVGTDLWVPITRFFATAAQSHIDVTSRRSAQFELIGRLAPGRSVGDARAELDVLHRRLAARFPDDYDVMRPVVTPILDTVVGDSRQVLLFLLAAAALVFVIAGVNVATLLMMRAADARREFAMRVALGATRRHLASQALAESLVLGLLGVLAALLAADVFLPLVRWLAPGVPRIDRAGVNLQVAGFCALAGCAWVLALGTAPAWTHRHLSAAAAGALDRSFGGSGVVRGLRAFTIAQIAAAVLVSIAAGLLVRSFGRLSDIDRGFDASRLAVVTILLPDSRYPDARARLAFYDELLPRVAAVPGVIAAAPVHLAPGTGTTGLSAGMIFEGQSDAEAAKNPWATWEPVTPTYFRTLGIPIVRGRGFTDADSRDGAKVAVVSEAVARRYWPDRDPVGKRLQFTSQFEWVTVVGVAADVRYRELTRPWLTVYFPAAQFFFFSPGSLVVRASGAPESVIPAIREVIRAQEPHIPLESATTMDTLLARELARPRAALTVAALFAGLAIVLAAIGVYGVVSYEVRARRRELAVRAALGAAPRSLSRAVVLQSLSLGAAGILCGVAVAAASTRMLRSLLFEVDPGDPGIFASGALAVLVTVALASYIPARRAASADPLQVLRTE
jgi:predicted permease